MYFTTGSHQQIPLLTLLVSVFLENLEKRAKEWEPIYSKLGDIFLIIVGDHLRYCCQPVEQADFAQLYSKYIENYATSHPTLKTLLPGKDFAAFLSVKLVQ